MSFEEYGRQADDLQQGVNRAIQQSKDFVREETKQFEELGDQASKFYDSW